MARAQDGEAWRTALLAAAALSGFAAVLLALVVAPQARGFAAPLAQRIFYFHVPTAWVAYLAFLVTFIGSVQVLRDADAPRWDRVAAASAEVGTLFAAMALATGLIWARVEFVGYDPAEDPKLITLVALLLAYAAYLALRRSLDEPGRRARLSAVFGVAAFVGVPLSYLASRASVHPDFATGESSLAPALRNVLLASLLAFTLIYAHLLAERAELARLQERVDALSHRAHGGDAVW